MIQNNNANIVFNTLVLSDLVTVFTNDLHDLDHVPVGVE